MLDKYTDEEVREIWEDTFKKYCEYMEANPHIWWSSEGACWLFSTIDTFEYRLPGVTDLL